MKRVTRIVFQTDALNNGDIKVRPNDCALAYMGENGLKGLIALAKERLAAEVADRKKAEKKRSKR